MRAPSGTDRSAEKAVAFLVMILSLASASLSAGEPKVDREAQAARLHFFEQKVRPLLVQDCQSCHGATKQKGGLRLDSREAILKGGDSGPAIVPGKPDESLIVSAVNYDGLEMPPACKLEPAKLEIVAKWVSLGAPWTPLPTERTPKSISSASAETRSPFSDIDRAFWSFQPLRSTVTAQAEGCLSACPEEACSHWSQNPIDRFILKRLLEKGLNPAPEADRRILIRRATFDLHGLPPTPEEINAFLTDSGVDAYERLIDRLLASPRYGQRWARHWLDLVRYAESDGYRQDAFRPNAWRYRDYVVRAFNADKRYDQFIIEQLAGDELAQDDPEGRVATGYLRLGTYEFNQRNVVGQWADILNDITDVTGEVFLGLSIGCARCHDHKFDPILQKDYYRLQAFFTPLLPRDDLTLAPRSERAEYEIRLKTWDQSTADLRRAIAAIERPDRDKAAQGAIAKFPDEVKAILSKTERERTPLEKQIGALAYRQVALEFDREPALKGSERVRREELKRKLKELEKIKPVAPPTVLAATDVGPVAPPTIIPGKDKSKTIEAGYLTVLDPAPAKIDRTAGSFGSTGRRLTLARWLTRQDNPLTTRVMANRLWQYHFGRGLVATSSDFGRLGEAPSHPELLDWLANELVASGWRLKPLHRLIMTSAAYRQSSERSESEVDAARRIDPDNRLLWKRTVQRLDAEEIHDAILAVTGELENEIGGASAEVTRPRRAIDTKMIRNSRDPLLDMFDAPDGYASAGRRNTTTTATQALLLINGSWTVDRAKALAERIERLAQESPTEANRDRVTGPIVQAFRLAYGREPDHGELSQAVDFLSTQARRVTSQAASAAREALIDFCHALLNSSEFLYVD
jgi:hypothetical protein